MAQGLAFHYFPGNSPLHRWDSRCKFLGLIFTTMGLLHMNAIALAIFSCLLAIMIVLARLPWARAFRDSTAWAWLLLIIFLLQAFALPEHSAPASREYILTDWVHVRQALLTCWRLVLVLSYAILFTSATRPRDLQNALTWLLRPIPFLPARRIALMASLTVRFIPLILDELDEVRLAVRSRGGSRRKSPLLRIKHLALPLLRRSILRADELAVALHARGYREDLPLELPKIPAAHLIPLFPLAIVVWLCTAPFLAG